MLIHGQNALFDEFVPLYHEAGHCVAAHLLGLTILSVNVQATPDGMHNGATCILQVANLDSSDINQFKSIRANPAFGIKFIYAIMVFIRAGWAGADLCRDERVREAFDIYQSETTRSDWEHVELLQPYTDLSMEEITAASSKLMQVHKKAVKELAWELRDKRCIQGEDVHQFLSGHGCDRAATFAVPE